MEHFGTSPFDGRIILLNKVPGDDRSDEVIVDGIKAGLMWFDPVTKSTGSGQQQTVPHCSWRLQQRMW